MSISMLKLQEILEDIAPLEMQEDWDNSGMQIDMGRSSVSRILVCLEITGEVVEEALNADADLIVTHHPLLFRGIRRIDRNDAAGRNLIDLITGGISVYSAHTCFDSAPGGNNDDLAERLRLRSVSELGKPECGEPECGKPEDGTEERGEQERRSFATGAKGYLETPMRLSDFAIYLDEILENPGGLKVSGDAERIIQKVGLCTGAGGEFLPAAAQAGCDVYISGDLKHHEVQEAKENGLCVIDAGHYGTEFLFAENMAKKLRARTAGQVEVLESQVNADPYDFVL